MKSTRIAFWCLAVSCLIALCGTAYPALADELATITGRITDPQGLVVAGVKVEATNINTNIAYSGESNADGLYRIPSIPPGAYRVIVQKTGFAQILKPGVELHVQDIVTLNFAMQLGSVSQTITVEGGAPLINTESAAVSTVVDRQFVENMPLNGRSFQTLIALSPGVVVTPSGSTDPGQFSVNGQRSSANYFTIDGVSANVGVLPGSFLSQTAGGSTPGFSATGGTNNLVSEDALQEFRIQTSTFAPEFGRTPGAQVSILTRSGTNQSHGTLFEYLRNDKLDANEWFANQKGLPKAEERINDFGGVFGGPIVKDRTFFFFSYEGQRLRLPQTGISTVPNIQDRQNASPAIQPFLNAYPMPNNGVDGFNATFSDQSSLNAASIRIDHKLNDRLAIFGRYNYAPSDSLARGGGLSLNTRTPTELKTQTLTLGGLLNIAPHVNADFRFNYSRIRGATSNRLDTFGGAVVPPDSVLFPAPFSSEDAHYLFLVFGLQNGGWILGKSADNLQRQINLVGNVSVQKGAHSLQFGGDYRRLTPDYNPSAYGITVLFADVASVLAGTPAFPPIIDSNTEAAVVFRNLSLYAQDSWRINPRLTATYGLRWDVDFTPRTIDGPPLSAVTGFNDLNTLALAPPGAPVFKTRYNNLAPRIGVAYQLRQSQGLETVVRGGFGVFYDLKTVQVGDTLFIDGYPFGAINQLVGATFPLDPALIQPPPITCTGSTCQIAVFDPDLRLPRTFQWNVTLEQSLRNKQSVSAAYVAAVGRRLLQPEFVFFPNPNFLFVELVRNASTSDYHSLQLQFQRRMAKGLQALASYTWSHSIDTDSSSSLQNANAFVRGEDPNANRGHSDFDIRHTLSAAVTYDIPAPRTNRVIHALISDWSLQNIVQARSAPPVNVFDSSFFIFGTNSFNVRPDVVPGQSFYLNDATAPGGMRINRAAFVDPPVDPMTGFPLRQGNLGRNTLRGFGAAQWDFAVRREFPLHESLRLQFRAEFFNLLNHPNFANPIGDLSSPFFGQSIATLARGLGGGVSGSGGFAPIFQFGGPRSIQFGFKLQF